MDKPRSDDPAIKYYGLERDYTGKGEWIQCGIIGATSDITYTAIREAISFLEDFRVRPIDNKLVWADTFKAGKIIEFKALCTAALILCTKPPEAEVV